MTELNIVSIRELIDSSFGDEDENSIDFRSIQTVMFILARQLRILQRHVSIEKERRLHSMASISVTEVKIHAKRKQSGKDSSSSSQEEARKGGKGGEQQAQKGGKDGEQQVQKGGKGSEQQTQKGGKGGKGGEQQEQKGGKGGEQQTQKGGKGGDQQAQKGGKGGDQQAQKGGKGGEQQAQKGGKGGEQQAQKGGKSGKGGIDQESAKSKKSSGKMPDTKSSSTEPYSTDDTTTTTRTLLKSSKSSAVSESATAGEGRGAKSQKSNIGATGRKSEARGKGGKDDAMDLLHEKLLIVSRTQSEADIDSEYDPASSVVTLAQYQSMFLKIRDLQTRFGITDLIELPKDKAFREKLQRQFSLTDPMAAVQLSARLADAESKLQKMMPVAIQHASAIPGINLEAAFDDAILKQGNINWEGAGAPQGPSSQTPPGGTHHRKSAAFKQPPPKKRSQSSHISGAKIDSDEESSEMGAPTLETISIATTTEVGTGAGKKVTYDELYERLDDITNEVMKGYTGTAEQSTKAADNALKVITQYDTRLTAAATNLGDRFSKLDFAIEVYADEVNYLDTKLASQMTEYQDTLTQMQYDLETGMDALAEALASPSEDAAAIAELNQHFTSFQYDIDGTAERQRELRREEQNYSLDLNDLKRQIQALQRLKSTREEVIEALSDKAGIAALNGMVSMHQFDAVRGDLEKRIASSYDKFNSREIIWQKHIDDLIRELNEKADYYQMLGLEQEIQKYLGAMKGTLTEMLNVVGDMDVNKNEKKIDRTEDCLCCGTAANIEAELDEVEEALLRPPVIGAESVEKQEDDTRTLKVCVPGHPVDHKLDRRALICQRYCGSTVESQLKHESEFKMMISGLNPPGPGGKAQAEKFKTICTSCNVERLPYHTKPIPKKPSKAIPAADLVSEPVDVDSEAQIHCGF